jgi:hypothetical protein
MRRERRIAAAGSAILLLSHLELGRKAGGGGGR